MNNQPMETIHMEVAAMIQVTVMIKVMTTRVMTAVMTNNPHMVHNNHHMANNIIWSTTTII